MNGFGTKIKLLCYFMYLLSGIALASIMMLTVFDVILRTFYRPIAGVYDLTIFLGAIFGGFSIPFTSWKRAHIYMTFFLDTLPLNKKKTFNVVTSSLGIFLFLLFGWTLISYGIRLYRQEEVSLTLRLPFYPIVLGIGISCLINSFVLLIQLLGNFDEEKKT